MKSQLLPLLSRYTSIATVSIALLVSGCGGGGSSSSSPIVSGKNNTGAAVTLDSISLTPSTTTLTTGGQVTLTATGNYSDGSNTDISNQVVWSTSDGAVAGISAGIVTANSAGYASITATKSGITSSAAGITVTAATMNGLTLSPSTLTMVTGQSLTYSATASYNDSSTGNVSGLSTWSSSNTGVATVNSQGIVTTVSPGTTTITAVNGGFTATATLTVTAPAAGDGPLAGVFWTYGGTSNTAWAQVADTSVPNGGAVFKAATITHSETTSASITENIPTAGIVGFYYKISSEYNYDHLNFYIDGVLQGSGSGAVAWAHAGYAITAGTHTLTWEYAKDSSVNSGSDTIWLSQVTLPAPATLSSIALTPASNSVTTGQTANFTATGTYSDSSTADITTQATWASSNTAVATIDNTGLMTAVGAGSASITATLNGITSTAASIVVTPPSATLTSVSVTPLNVGLTVSQTSALTAMAGYSDGSSTNISSTATWSSSNTAVATVDGTGLVTAVAAGTANITASSGGFTSNASAITVAAAAMNALNLTPINPSIIVGQTLAYTATATYTDTSTGDVSSTSTWTSSNTAVATVSSTGVVTGIGAGSATITAVNGGFTATDTLTVTAPATTTGTGPLTGVTWTYSGTSATAWSNIVDGTVPNGGAVYQAAPIDHLQTSTASITENIPVDGFVTFYYKVESEANYDFLTFSIDGVQQGAWSGAVAWTQASYPITAGSHTLTWTYSKDGSWFVGLDTAWVSQVTLPVAASAAHQMGGAIQGVPLTLAANVTTFAGTGAPGAVDGTGTAASFYGPTGVTTDGTNLYVADYANHKIRKIEIATGIVTTLAGSGVASSVDGTGTAASFNYPSSITTDGTNLYVSDVNGFKIRKVVIATGVVTTLAGSGVLGSVDGTGTAASFGQIYGMTTDGINLYVADFSSNKIRKAVIATGVVSTLAGSGTAASVDGTGTAASFNRPIDVTTDGTNLYVAEYLGNKVRKIVIATGVVSTLAGSGASGSVDGTGTAASFTNPYGITTDGISLFVSELSNKIRQIDIATGVVSTLAGSGALGSVDGTGTAASFATPWGITTDGVSLFVNNYGTHTVRRIQ
jgi:uncharacterized protein YjdB